MMQVSVETTQGLERKLTFGIPGQEVEQETNKRLMDIANNYKMNGFRQGRIPINVVKKRFGVQVKNEVVSEKVQKAFYDQIIKSELQPAGAPKIEPKQGEDGPNPMEFIATFEVLPEINLSDYSEISIKKPSAAVTQEDLQKMIQTLREQRAKWNPVERAANEQDQITIDFVGRNEDGEVFDGGTAEDFKVVIGSKSMIPGFEEGLTNKSKNDETTLELTFPEDYQNSDLAGTNVSFAITIKQVCEKELPELEELAEQLGITDKGIDKLNQEVMQNMERELSNGLRNNIKEIVMDALIESNEVELPNVMIQNEIEQIRQQTIQRMLQGSPDAKLPDLPELPAELFEKQAKKRVKLGLIVSEIVKKEELTAEPEKVASYLEEMASAYESPADVIAWYTQDKNRIAEIEHLVLEQEIVDTILTKANIEEYQSTFDEVLNWNKPGYKKESAKSENSESSEGEEQ